MRANSHDDVIKWKHFPRYWPFVRGIHRSPVNSPHKGQWHGALMFSLICAWINGWVNNRWAGDLRRHRAHYDVTVMRLISTVRCLSNDCSLNSLIKLTTKETPKLHTTDNLWHMDSLTIHNRRGQVFGKRFHVMTFHGLLSVIQPLYMTICLNDLFSRYLSIAGVWD